MPPEKQEFLDNILQKIKMCGRMLWLNVKFRTEHETISKYRF